MKVLVLLLLMLAGPVTAEYEIVDLGTLSGGYSFATDIDEQGQICGYGYTQTSVQAFVGDMRLISKMTVALGIGNNGTIVGTALFHNRVFPAVHRKGRTRLLKTLGGDFGYAKAVEGRIVVGAAGKRYGNVIVARPCLWRGNRPKELFHQRGSGWANDISPAMIIVGTFFPEGRGPKAFLWYRGRVTFLGPGYGTAINIQNWVVGYADIDGKFQSIIWRPRPKVLPSLGGQAWANDVNDKGEIVGLAETSVGYRAVMWKDDIITDLNDLFELDDWIIFSAQAINNSGQIACRGREKSSGRIHALLLNPI